MFFTFQSNVSDKLLKKSLFPRSWFDGEEGKMYHPEQTSKRTNIYWTQPCPGHLAQ